MNYSSRNYSRRDFGRTALAALPMAAAFAAPTFVTIIADRALELVALVDETDIGAVAANEPVTFNVEAFPERELRGHVTRVAPKAVLVSGVVNYETTVAIDSPTDVLKPDMTATVVIHTTPRPGAAARGSSR